MEEARTVPDVGALSDGVRPCLEELDILPRDLTRLFKRDDADEPFGMDNSLLPSALDLYVTLGVDHEPLTLTPPDFVCPHPPLVPATFHPRMNDPIPPPLDRFDLDKHFAEDGVRLARLTNKCSADEDLEYYVREAADIVGLIGEGGERKGVGQRYVDDGGEGNTKAILSEVFRKVRNTPDRGRPGVVFFFILTLPIYPPPPPP